MTDNRLVDHIRLVQNLFRTTKLAHIMIIWTHEQVKFGLSEISAL